MDYKKHYDLLCERAKTRKLDCYTESHHVIPRCMGGTDASENLVNLTPEEHYVAHQLLVKMYPEHKGLVWAAYQMTWHSNGKRNNNKLYGWLRRKNQKLSKQRKGNKNGSYGKYWYHDPKTLTIIKCSPDEIPNGFVKGKAPNTKCLICGSDTGGKKRKYCDIHRTEIRNSKLKAVSSLGIKKAIQSPHHGRRKHSDDVIRTTLIRNEFDITKTMKVLGYKGKPGNNTWRRIKRIKNSIT